jgi:O-antigen ligase
MILIVLLQLVLRAPGTVHTPRLELRSVHLLMCLAVIYVAASAIAAGTLTSEAGFLALIDKFGVTPYLMFLVAPAVFAGRRERNLLLVTLVGLGAYLGLTAIFESVGPHSLIFPRYILNVDEALSGERAGGPFQSSVAEGFSTFACAVAAAIAFAQWHNQRRRYVAGFVTVVCVFGCFVTLERGVWIAAIAAAIVTALATPTGRRWLIPGALACTVTIGGALVLSSNLATKTSTRVSTQRSVWDRQNQTAAGLRMIEARPLFGFGWNRYRTDSLEYFRQASDYPMTGYNTLERSEPLHDSYLAYAVELGLIGALLWIASLLWGVGISLFNRRHAALRPWRLGLLAIATFFLVVGLFNPYQAPFPVLLLWVWAAVALGSEPLSTQARRARTLAGVPRSNLVWVT